ncbi:unnamed protein product [Caenorhabditis nigoni]|uniref:Uncharacterized protein n=1 Tax=Caenorhabditis nigoni TaxID=1611254 RepID=A0A2G5SRM2_9PELO|nr:hypothetical protein B9Z55_023839 [Caenorhabditis nigoni]
METEKVQKRFTRSQKETEEEPINELQFVYYRNNKKETRTYKPFSEADLEAKIRKPEENQEEEGDQEELIVSIGYPHQTEDNVEELVKACPHVSHEQALSFLQKYDLEKSIELAKNYRPPNLAAILLGKNFGSEPFTILEDKEAGSQLKNQFKSVISPAEITKECLRQQSRRPVHFNRLVVDVAPKLRAPVTKSEASRKKEREEEVPAAVQTVKTPEEKENKSSSNGIKKREEPMKSKNGLRTAAIKNSETRKNGHFGDSQCETDEEEEKISLKNRLRSSMTTVKKESSESDTEEEEDMPPAQKRNYSNAVVRKQNNVESSEDSSGDGTAAEDHAVETEHLRRNRRARRMYSPSPVRFSTGRKEKKKSTDSDGEKKQESSGAQRLRGRPPWTRVNNSKYVKSDSESSSDEEFEKSRDSDDEGKMRPSGSRRLRGRPLSTHMKKAKYADPDSETSDNEDEVAPTTKAQRKVAQSESQVKVPRGRPAKKSAAAGTGSSKKLRESSQESRLSSKRTLRKRNMQRPSASEPSRKKRCGKESDSDSEFSVEF